MMYIFKLEYLMLLPVIFGMISLPLRRQLSVPLITLQVISLMTILAFVLYSLITANFRLAISAFYVSSILPLSFRICSLWASPQGSLLLWSSLISLLSFSSFYLCRARDTALSMLKVQAAIVSIVLAFMYLYANPLLPSDMNLAEGLGLNPALQDYAMAWHPPIMYIGYALSSIMASYCLVYLYTHDEQIFDDLLPLSRLAWLSLTTGVVLGSCWAYREIGWGGFWSFDPVENISMMPLLTSTALHHTLLLTIKQARMRNWTIILAWLTFILTLFSILAVRSGLLISVHTFTANSHPNLYILYAIGSCILLYSLAFSYKLSDVPITPRPAMRWLSKEMGIAVGNIVWVFCTIMLLTATLYPVFFNWYAGAAISIERGFFDYFIFALLPSLLLAASLGYMKINANNNNKILILFFVSLVIGGVLAWYLGLSTLQLFSCISALSLMVTSIYQTLTASQYFRKALRINTVSFLTGHLGYGLLVFSIGLNSIWQEQVEFSGQVGQVSAQPRFDLSMQRIYYAHGPNYLRQIAEFRIEDKLLRTITILKPECRLYKIENLLTSSSDIYSSLFYDLQINILNVEQSLAGSTVQAIIFYRPAMGAVRLSALIMIIGIALSLFTEKRGMAARKVAEVQTVL